MKLGLHVCLCALVDQCVSECLCVSVCGCLWVSVSKCVCEGFVCLAVCVLVCKTIGEHVAGTPNDGGPLI